MSYLKLIQFIYNVFCIVIYYLSVSKHPFRLSVLYLCVLWLLYLYGYRCLILNLYTYLQHVFFLIFTYWSSVSKHPSDSLTFISMHIAAVTSLCVLPSYLKLIHLSLVCFLYPNLLLVCFKASFTMSLFCCVVLHFFVPGEKWSPLYRRVPWGRSFSHAPENIMQKCNTKRRNRCSLEGNSRDEITFTSIWDYNLRLYPVFAAADRVGIMGDRANQFSRPLGSWLAAYLLLVAAFMYS